MLAIVIIVEVSSKVKKLLSVVGPTAIGKTQLAIALARHFDTEIISADSRQFYKEIEIGTAVPSKEELELAKHHFVQHKSIFENYSVGDFERDAMKLLNNIFTENDVVIMVGGSGLYVDAVTKGFDKFPEIDLKIRERLNQKLADKGIVALQKELKKYDPMYYNRVDLENPHRLIRALEVSIGTGKPYSSFLSKEIKNRPFETVTIGLDADRQHIYNRINKRVDRMVEMGLVAEAKALEPFKSLNALQTVGYKELFNYFEGEYTLEFALSEIKKNTRRFAKRQLTWFKRNSDCLWFAYDSAFDEIISRLEKKHFEKK
ncbi:MAG: tRNA (adenosine(37)-N6)-dimethylallyltransferase MiaA [Pricia sp.]|nr:tRNA (adenosine(37)-N6)-dimethylallyltransferase MiaA [Pricia sp.]